MTMLPKVVHELFADETAAANHYDLHMFIQLLLLCCFVVFFGSEWIGIESKKL
jgi:hypothetical protein